MSRLHFAIIAILAGALVVVLWLLMALGCVKLSLAAPVNSPMNTYCRIVWETHDD